MSRIRSYIHSNLTPEVLNEAATKYKFAREMLRDTGINVSDLKRAYEYHKISYPFARKKGMSYKPTAFVDEQFFTNEDEKSFYWAGFLAADGCIRENKKKNGSITYFVSCGLASSDRSHLEKLKIDIGYSGNINNSIIKAGPLVIKGNINKKPEEHYYKSEIAIVSKKLFDDIQKFGLAPAKTYSYTMPEWLINHQFVNHFIRGYMDGDGSIGGHQYPHTEGLRLSLVGACPAVKQIFDIFNDKCDLRRGGSFSEIKNEYGTIINRFEFNSIYDFKQITNYLYQGATVYLQRKYEAISKIDKIMEASNIYYLDGEEIQNKYDKMGSFSAVAKEIGCNPGVISRTIKKYGTRTNTQEEINDNHRTYHFNPEKLKIDYEQYQSSNKLAELYSCSAYTILFYLKKFNIPHLEQGSNFIKKYFIDFNKEELQNKYNELRAIDKLADFYKCDINTIRKTFKQFDIKVFPPAGQKNKYVFDPEKLKQEYDKLRSLTAVAKIYGCDRAIISNAMKKFNIPYKLKPNQTS